MKSSTLRLLCFASVATAQLESSSVEIITVTGSNANFSVGDAPAVTVPSDFIASTIGTNSLTAISGSEGTSNSSTTATSAASSEATYTQLVGGTRSTSSRASATSTSAAPVNTQACNNYPEFCDRKYSNITEVCAHNSPFVRPRNVASNQELTVTQQLNDGIRVLQGQAHFENDTLYYCHTSCDLLNAGPVEDYLRTVTEWVASHPFDVLTIIFGNYNYRDTDKDGNRLVSAQQFADPIERSGLLQYIYQPPKTAMTLDDWPTLGEMILSGKRVVTFIDYGPNTTAVPYLLWQFYNVWETPFSPTAEDFTCEIQRPDGLTANKSREMMYMANHNLNVQVNIAGAELLIPNAADLNQTNGVEGNTSLGAAVEKCDGKWNRPPNFLLVDFYNRGSPESGSVFEVAARANNVTYDRQCCGQSANVAGSMNVSAFIYAVIGVMVSVFIL